MINKKSFILSLFLYFPSCYCHEIKWENQSNKKTSYLFAPGIHSSERHIAKYCNGYIASTGQLVYTDNDFVVIGNMVRSVNFPDVILDNNYVRPFKVADLLKPKKVLSNIYNNIVKKRNRSNDRNEKITIQKKETSGPNVESPAINLNSINLGQEGDIAQLSLEYDQHCARLNDSNIVLYGVSRGAATAFNFMATKYFEKETKNIKAVILEGCFDSIRNLLRYRYSKKFPPLQKHVEKAFNFIYPGHNLEGIEPNKLVDNFPKDIPVLFITSKKDTVVPYKSTWNLYRALKKSGHENVYILELKHSAHPRYMIDNPEDKKAYEAVVHAFYKKFDLPYNPELIEFGDTLLNKCQPK